VRGEGGRRIRLVLPEYSDLKREISTLPGVLSMVEYLQPKLFNDVARRLLGSRRATARATCRSQVLGRLLASRTLVLTRRIPTLPGE
jgi:hypothetical protein